MKIVLKIASLAARVLPGKIKTAFYRSPKLASKIRGALNAASPNGFTNIEVAGGLLHGYHLNLDMQTEKDYWLGTYEVNLQTMIRTLCRKNMVVYDIGANIGYISLLFAKQTGKSGQVFAFEPLPENCSRLEKNIALNNLENSITLIQAAVIDKSGSTTFMVHKSGAMGKAVGSKGRDEEYLMQIIVPAVSLDDFVFTQNNPPPKLIKMDIEGGEVLAIKGMQRTLKEVKPVILVEIHSHQALECLWRDFRDADYQLFRIEKEISVIENPADLGEKTYALAKPK